MSCSKVVIAGARENNRRTDGQVDLYSPSVTSLKDKFMYSQTSGLFPTSLNKIGKMFSSQLNHNKGVQG